VPNRRPDPASWLSMFWTALPIIDAPAEREPKEPECQNER
jgi:hypothetical protein